MTRRFALAAFVGAAAFGVVSPASAADMKLRLGSAHSSEQQAGKLLKVFAEEVNSAGVGLEIKPFLDGVLGSGEELMEDTIRGNVDMTFAYVYANTDPVLEINSLPYLVATADEMRATFGDVNSPFGQVMAETMERNGLRLLANTAEGYVGIITTERPNDPTGLGDKGLNIRVWNSNIGKVTTEALGYNTTTMNWAEVFAAVQAGTVDGAICCTPISTWDVFATSDVGKYFTPLHAFAESQSFYMNLDVWNSMNAEQQQVVQTAAQKMGRDLLEWSLNNEQAYIEKLRGAGWEILALTDEEHAAQAEHIKSVVWPMLAESVGQDVLDRLSGN